MNGASTSLVFTKIFTSSLWVKHRGKLSIDPKSGYYTSNIIANTLQIICSNKRKSQSKLLWVGAEQAHIMPNYKLVNNHSLCALDLSTEYAPHSTISRIHGLCGILKGMSVHCSLYIYPFSRQKSSFPVSRNNAHYT